MATVKNDMVPLVSDNVTGFSIYKVAKLCCKPVMLWPGAWVLGARESFVLRVNELKSIDTGLFFSIPSSHYGSITTFFQWFYPTHFHVASTIVYPNYLGECKVMLYNKSKKTIFVTRGQSIAFFNLHRREMHVSCGRKTDLYVDCELGTPTDKSETDEKTFLAKINDKRRKNMSQRRVSYLSQCGIV